MSVTREDFSDLLTVGNPKTAKGEGFGFLTAIMHFAPAKLAGFEVCASRSAGCTAACLNTAGRGGFDPKIPRARIARTKLFREDRKAFSLKLEREILAHIRRAKRNDLKPAIRLNGTSDLPFENIKLEWKDGSKSTVFERFPNVQFYDYTKHAMRFKRELPSNYDLTFSLAEDNDNAAHFVLENGGRVAVVFRAPDGQPKRSFSFPETWRGYEVTDADTHDLRFLDKPNTICGLRAKGLGKKDTTGFVREVF